MPAMCHGVAVQLPVEQREGIPHHLIDILDPSQEFSAGDFQSLGRKAAEDIIAVSDCADDCTCASAFVRCNCGTRAEQQWPLLVGAVT